MAAAHAGGVERGHEPAEGTHPGEGAEAVGVTEAGEDLGTGDGTDARRQGEDRLGVGLPEEERDALVERGDLVCEGEGEPGLDGDVLGELVEVEGVLRVPIALKPDR